MDHFPRGFLNGAGGHRHPSVDECTPGNSPACNGHRHPSRPHEAAKGGTLSTNRRKVLPYRKTLRINLFGIEPPVEEALLRGAPLDRFEHAVEAFPTVDGEAFCSCDIAVVDLRLFAGSPGGPGRRAALRTSRRDGASGSTRSTAPWRS